jgi:AbrB family looped-hinge helix DNA binding protein
MDRSSYLGRTVTKSGQISLPAALMDRVGLDVGDWVYFVATRDGAAIEVLPAARVGLMGERLKG